MEWTPLARLCSPSRLWQKHHRPLVTLHAWRQRQQRPETPCTHTLHRRQQHHDTTTSRIPIFTTTASIRTHVRSLRAATTSPPNPHPHGTTTTDNTIGFVPTLGGLHAGHMALIRAACAAHAHVVVSLYLNPAQFGAHEDLATYPARREADVDLLNAFNSSLPTHSPSSAFPSSVSFPSGADSSSSRMNSAKGKITAIFAPPTHELYPSGAPSQDPLGAGTFVSVTPLGSVLEGASRPVFFRGVATVCAKLFNAVAPDAAFFGQKDVQQTRVVKKMVRDLLVPLEVVVVPTVRDGDGVALSSRNAYLGGRRRAVARVLSRVLGEVEGEYVRCKGEVSAGVLRERARVVLKSVLQEEKAKVLKERALFEVDYVSIAESETLEELKDEDVVGRTGAVVSGAIKMFPLEDVQQGKEKLGEGGDTTVVRLIDNIELPPVDPR